MSFKPDEDGVSPRHVKQRSRRTLNHKPAASVESIEDMMLRLHEQFPEDIRRLAEHERAHGR